MTPEELDRIEALAAAATPGPWAVRNNSDEGRGVSAAPTPEQDGRGDDIVSMGSDAHPLDLVFVADARTSVPALVLALREALALAAAERACRVALLALAEHRPGESFMPLLRAAKATEDALRAAGGTP